MTTRLHFARTNRVALAAALLLSSANPRMGAQATGVAKTPPASASPVMPAVDGQEIDRVVAIVDGDLILDSDVDEERRFTAFQPFRDRATDFSRDKAIERLINRDLILQQIKLLPDDPISDADVKKELDALRKSIPDCKKFACETDAGWANFLEANGFTEQTLMERWRKRMQVLRFIEERFRMGTRIQPADIKNYYEKTMLPEYERQHQTPPKLDAISDRIQEVLLQQQVSTLLSDWLKSLRAQGSVVVLKQGEVAP